MKHIKPKEKAIKFTSWFVYVMIFFEMFYMATPFAVFFYSVYGAPLKWLNSNPITSILVQPILPHFSQSGSIMVNTLLFISWPLMGAGLIIFFIGFVQIYWAKLRKKGAVLGGIYKYIRHPQYVAWSVFGLGMAIFWSRMIVLILFVTMLFVYYILAKIEERECLEKYGDSYREYMTNTGRFFPLGARSKEINCEKAPKGKVTKIKILIGAYVTSLTLVVLVGLYLRSYSISSLSTYSDNNYIVLSARSLKAEDIKSELEIALIDYDFKENIEQILDISKDNFMVYLLPASWNVSELGIDSSSLHESHSSQVVASSPFTHGNAVGETNLKKLIFSDIDTEIGSSGIDILKNTRSQTPKLLVYIDTESREVLDIKKIEGQGRYKDIPVPLY